MSTQTITVEDARATWTASYINDLPDSAFLFVESGGSKDSEGKTTPRSLRHFPYKDADGKVDMPHLRNALSRIPQSNLPAAVKDRLTAKAQRILEQQTGGQTASARPPETGFRAVSLAPELRTVEDGGSTLHGHFAVFDAWTEINSRVEGRFMERIVPGAFKKTFAENRGGMRVLFDHGHDPSIGNKPLGQIVELAEDGTGAYYEVELLDTSYNRDLVKALKARLLGASFRFRAIREDFNTDVEPAEHNPEGLPERSLQEIKVMEFGPVTFPAYAGATAGVRSLTDDYAIRAFLQHPDRELLVAMLPTDGPQREDTGEDDTGPEDDTGADAPDDGSAEPEAHPVTSRRVPLYGLDEQERPSWQL